MTLTYLWGEADHVCSFIHKAEVDVRCGLHPWELHPERPNRLRITVKLFARMPNGPASVDSFIDYDDVRKFLKTLSSREHIPLLETIANEIAGVCFSQPSVDACWIGIEKPLIFSEAAGAGVELYRTRQSWEADPDVH
jgi:dihydroneopterin aldolase